MIRLESISKNLGDKTVLHNFSLEIGLGERHTLLGKSGCGKTTLLRLIAGFERVDAGKIFIAGEDVGDLPVEKRSVGFIFQNYALFPHKTVHDNIATGLRIRNVPEAEIEKRVDELLIVTHLTRLRNAWPEKLSGGEAQRVAIGRAIINQPKVLLLDEPFSALDPSLRQDLRKELAEMQKTLGITFLFVTHDQEEAMSLSTRMSILHQGRIEQVGTPTQVYNVPVSPFVADFLGKVNKLEGIVEQSEGSLLTISLGDAGNIRCQSKQGFPEGKPITCYIRPEMMSITPMEKSTETMNNLRAIVGGESFHGSHSRFALKLGNGQFITVPHKSTVAENSVQNYRKDQSVFICFPVQSVTLFTSDEVSQ